MTFTSSCDHTRDKLNEYYNLTKNNGRAESIPRCLCSFVRLFSIVLCSLMPTTILVLCWRAGLLGCTKVLQHRKSSAFAWPGPCKQRQVLSASALFLQAAATETGTALGQWMFLQLQPVSAQSMVSASHLCLSNHVARLWKSCPVEVIELLLLNHESAELQELGTWAFLSSGKWDPFV